MLKTPAFQYFDDLSVTIYQDDTKFWKFYQLPDRVALRRDANDKPIFQLIKYAFSDDARETDPDLPHGGGLMNFDVELRLPENDEVSLRTRLQAYVDGEWNRLKSLADAENVPVESLTLPSWHNRTNGVPRPVGDPTTPPALAIDDVMLGLDPDRPNAPPGDRPPEIELSYPEWTKGTFALTVPSSDALVTSSVSEGPLSLTGANNASAMVELTESGATLIQKTLTNEDGSGASDLLPIALRMDLQFMARIPPVKLDIQADTRAVYQAMESIDHDFDDNGCHTDDIAHYETNLEMAVESKLIDVKFDTGMLAADDDLIQEIRSTAMGLVEDLLTERLFDRAPQDTTTGGDLIKDERDYYILKETSSVDYSRIQYRETMTSIIEAEKHPQATLQGFFSGIPAAEMQQFIRVVDLTDTFFQTLGLTVNCFADFENSPISFVEVQLQYRGTDENGQQVLKTETFTFDGVNGSQEWDPSLIGSNRSYSSRWRIAYEGHAPEDWTRWEGQSMPVLNIAVPNTGKVDVQVLGGRIDFVQIIDQVQVEVSYEDGASGVNKIAETFQLTGGEQDFRFTHSIFTERDKSLKWSAKFFLKDGQVIETDEESEDSSTLLINAPLFDTLDVNLIPVGNGWDDVEQAVVDLFYEDPNNNYVVDTSMLLKSKSEFKEWNVVLQDRQLRTFRYKVTTSFKDGGHKETDFITLDSDQSVQILVEDQPHLNVKIMPNLVDFVATPVVTCTMRYEDAANSISDVQTFVFDETNKSMQDWDLLISEDGPVTYTREIKYHTFHGTIVRDPEESDETVFTLSRIAVPEVRCIFNARQVDFIDTPLIELQINYIDDVNGNDTTASLTIENNEERPVFQHNVGEDSPRVFDLTVIYHLADGSKEAFPTERVEKKQFIVARRIPDVVPAPQDPDGGG